MGQEFRQDFPMLGKGYVYLDSAATSQKPLSVVEAERDFYLNCCANPKRGMYELGLLATDVYEKARDDAREFLKAGSREEIIFTRNTTEALNLAAYSYGLSRLKKGDEVAVSILEHHSNLLPWQMVCQKTGAKLVYLYCEADGRITEEEIHKKIRRSTKLVAIGQVSNVTGRENPIHAVIRRAHEVGAAAVVDGAQAVPHEAVDVRQMDADFYAFSGHKMLGPMGIGVLYGKKELLESMPPFLTGGEMIESVSETGAVFAPLPEKFEAGTVNGAGAAGLSAAISYIRAIGYGEIQRRTDRLTEMAMEGMKKIEGIRILGSENPEEHHGILSFTLEGIHPHDIAAILDAGKIAVRAGHHCAQPLFCHLGVPAAARASFYFYNSEEDVKKFLEQLKEVRRWMGSGA